MIGLNELPEGQPHAGLSGLGLWQFWGCPEGWTWTLCFLLPCFVFLSFTFVDATGSSTAIFKMEMQGDEKRRTEGLQRKRRQNGKF